MPHSTRTVKKRNNKKTIKNDQKIKIKKKDPKKVSTKKSGQKDKKSIKTKSHFFEWDQNLKIQKMAISERWKRSVKNRPFFGVKCTKNR